VIGTIAIGHDITELREMHDKIEHYSKDLRESEEKLRVLHQHALQMGDLRSMSLVFWSSLSSQNVREREFLRLPARSVAAS
jgi:hypothetical protein